LTSARRSVKCAVSCGNSSVGRARPCQGRGREFESRFPLQILEAPVRRGFVFQASASALPRSTRGAGRPRPAALECAVHRPGGRVVMQRPAKPCTPVRFRPRPPHCSERLGLLPNFQENGASEAGPRFPSPPLRYVDAGTSLCRVASFDGSTVPAWLAHLFRLLRFAPSTPAHPCAGWLRSVVRRCQQNWSTVLRLLRFAASRSACTPSTVRCFARARISPSPSRRGPG
jgi:hypothetical protein